MSETAHTPEVWTTEHTMTGEWNIICGGWAFATLHYDYGHTCNAETHYRANLISAAPAMLAALKAIPDPDMEVIAAIAKAEGQP